MHLDKTVPREVVPLLNDDNAFKLAVFGANVSGGCAITSAEGVVAVDWNESVRIAQAADRAGLDALVPVARWRGLGGESRFNDRSFEPLTWATGLAGVTDRIQLLATVHVPVAHPVRIAKEAATVDHISGGRFGLNVVAGWNEPEFAMFGLAQRAHDDRYAVAGEWMEVIERLWSGERFDYSGEHIQATDAYTEPLPVQTPRPLVMSAGGSGAGQRFAARHADVNFVQAADIEGHTAKATEVRRLADELGRHIKVMGMGYVVCADTEKEARKQYDYYVNERGDWAGVLGMMGIAADNIEGIDFSVRETAANLIGGYSAQPLIGTLEQVVDGMLALSQAGLDGITLSWVNYEEGIAQYQQELLPLLIDAGLRSSRVSVGADA